MRFSVTARYAMLFGWRRVIRCVHHWQNTRKNNRLMNQIPQYRFRMTALWRVLSINLDPRVTSVCRITRFQQCGNIRIRCCPSVHRSYCKQCPVHGIFKPVCSEAPGPRLAAWRMYTTGICCSNCNDSAEPSSTISQYVYSPSCNRLLTTLTMLCCSLKQGIMINISFVITVHRLQGNSKIRCIHWPAMAASRALCVSRKFWNRRCALRVLPAPVKLTFAIHGSIDHPYILRNAGQWPDLVCTGFLRTDHQVVLLLCIVVYSILKTVYRPIGINSRLSRRMPWAYQ